jgi:hypothetical protein
MAPLTRYRFQRAIDVLLRDINRLQDKHDDPFCPCINYWYVDMCYCHAYRGLLLDTIRDLERELNELMTFVILE